MLYPDGKKIDLGDLIYYNEGSNKGIVAFILDTESDFKNFGIASPGLETPEQLRNYGNSEKGILICANPSPSAISIDVFCPETDFVDEGVSLIKKCDNFMQKKPNI